MEKILNVPFEFLHKIHILIFQLLYLLIIILICKQGKFENRLNLEKRVDY